MDRRAGRRILSRQRAFFGGIFLLSTVLLVSCGTDRKLDASQLEREITEQLLPQYPGAIRSVSCPTTTDPQPGDSLLCVATLGADVIDVRVGISGTEDALTTNASVDARFVATNEVAALLAATFGDQIGLVTSVDCGQPVVVLDEDESVICQATDPSGTTRAFDVTIDDQGQVAISLR